MYTVAILEDDPRQADALARMLAEVDQADSLEIQQVPSLAELDAWLPNGDILFADIKLGESFGGQNGIELVKTRLADAPTQVIYVTGYLEYCTPVYETEHVYLLAKPVRPEDLQAALTRAIANIERRRAERLVLSAGGSVVSLLPEEICFIESDRRKVRIHAGDEVVEAYATLGSLMSRLPASFINCHKSFLVNMDHIERIDKGGIVLRSGETVPVSRQKRVAVKQALLSRLGMAV